MTTWRVTVTTSAGTYQWRVQAASPSDFREQLNTIGHEHGLTLANVLEVSFVRVS